MIGRNFIIGLLLTPFVLTANPDTEGEALIDRIGALEEIIINAELETSDCQMRNAWHFPFELYNYLNLAKRYGENIRKGKNSRKFEECLQALLETLDECIEGKQGYWSGNSSDVWVYPVPSVPECALETFRMLREELESKIGALL